MRICGNGRLDCLDSQASERNLCIAPPWEAAGRAAPSLRIGRLGPERGLCHHRGTGPTAGHCCGVRAMALPGIRALGRAPVYVELSVSQHHQRPCGLFPSPQVRALPPGGIGVRYLWRGLVVERSLCVSPLGGGRAVPRTFTWNAGLLRVQLFGGIPVGRLFQRTKKAKYRMAAREKRNIIADWLRLGSKL